jgi:hypothetical protein
VATAIYDRFVEGLMATVQVAIPQNFISSMQQLMQTMQQMQKITIQFTQSAQQMHVPTQQAHAAQTQVMNRMNKLLQLFRKISATFVKAIDSIMNAMGTIAQTFLRGLALSAEILSPIVMAIGTTFSIAMYTSRFARWIWNKMVDLGDSMLQDWLLSSGMMATVGGLRSYRTAFGMLPDQQIIAQMPKARGYAASQQAIALGLLGVKNFRNSADMMVQATLAAAKFMKQQQKGQELKMAEASALTSLFSPRDLLALREIDEEELKERAELYEANKAKLEISEEARHGWMNFSIQTKVMWARIQTAIAEGMADPRSNFMQAFDQLSKSMVKFMKVLMDSPLVEKIFNWLAKQIEAFANKLSNDETISEFKKIATTIGEIIKLIYQATTILLGFGASFKMREKPSLLSQRYPGRARFMEHIGMRGEPRGPFGIVPGAKYERPVHAPAEVMPAPVTRYPGRARFAEKIGAPKPSAGAIPSAAPSKEQHYTGGNTSVAMSSMMDQLRKEGVPEANVRPAAALLVGQAQAESNLNPNLSHDQGTGYGIYGARLGRRTAMLEWLKGNGYAPNSLEGQSRYMAHEAMTGKGYGATRETLRRATPESIDKDSDVITRNFESPAVNNSRYRAGRARDAYHAPAPNASRPSGATTPSPPSPAPTKDDYVKPEAGVARRALGPGAGSSSLAEQRKRIGEELKDPETRRLLAASTNAEVGGQGSEAEHAYIESVTNRALSRNKSLKETLRDPHYYPETTKNKLDNRVSASDQARIDETTGKVLAGSNVTNYGTGNESGSVRSGGAQVTRDFGPRRERFIRENADLKWVNKQLARDGNQPLPKEAVKDPHSGQISVPQSGDPRLTTVGNYRLGGDQRRADLLKAGEAASKNLPPGWKVEAYSGQRDGPGQGPHAHSGAIDFRLIPPGKTFEQMKGADYQSPENFAVYEKFAQDTHLSLQKINPELAQQHRWGGYFSGPIGAGGKYGAMDLMHQDFAGGNARMAAGQWETGLHPAWQRAWGVGEHSSGIAERAKDDAVNASRVSPLVDKSSAWPEQGTKPVDYASNDNHPINNIKIDNRSDMDIHQAKTHSDNDSGQSETADQLAPPDHAGHHDPKGTESTLPPVTVEPDEGSGKSHGSEESE